MSPVLKMVLFGVFIVALARLIVLFKRLKPMLKRVREIKKVKTGYNVISVEGEIIEINTQPLDELDTEYDVKFYYEVGYQKFYKDFVLVNKQALRVGQKYTLLCEADNPENAMIQEFNSEFGEDFKLKSTVFNIVIYSIIIIVDSIFSALGYIYGDP